MKELFDPNQDAMEKARTALTFEEPNGPDEQPNQDPNGQGPKEGAPDGLRDEPGGEGDDLAGAQTEAGEGAGEAPAGGEEEAGQAPKATPEEVLAQQSKRARRAEDENRALKARLQSQQTQTDTLRQEMAQLRGEFDSRDTLPEDASDEDRAAHQTRQDDRDEKAALKSARDKDVQEQEDACRLRYDGTDGKPTFDAMMDEFVHLVAHDPDPTYQAMRERIVGSDQRNKAQVFYLECLELKKQRKELAMPITEDPPTADTTSGGGGSRLPRRPQPSRTPTAEEVEWVGRKKIFGPEYTVEDAVKQRLKREAGR